MAVGIVLAWALGVVGLVCLAACFLVGVWGESL
jgi:hypothetical protein